MGYTDKQGADAMQCRQAGNETICPECGAGTSRRRKPRVARRRLFYAGLACMVLLVGAVAYAVATGRPVPEVLGALFSVCVHLLMGV